MQKEAVQPMKLTLHLHQINLFNLTVYQLKFTFLWRPIFIWLLWGRNLNDTGYGCSHWPKLKDFNLPSLNSLLFHFGKLTCLKGNFHSFCKACNKYISILDQARKHEVTNLMRELSIWSPSSKSCWHLVKSSLVFSPLSSPPPTNHLKSCNCRSKGRMFKLCPCFQISCPQPILFCPNCTPIYPLSLGLCILLTWEGR